MLDLFEICVLLRNPREKEISRRSRSGSQVCFFCVLLRNLREKEISRRCRSGSQICFSASFCAIRGKKKSPVDAAVVRRYVFSVPIWVISGKGNLPQIPQWFAGMFFLRPSAQSAGKRNLPQIPQWFAGMLFLRPSAQSAGKRNPPQIPQICFFCVHLGSQREKEITRCLVFSAPQSPAQGSFLLACPKRSRPFQPVDCAPLKNGGWPSSFVGLTKHHLPFPCRRAERPNYSNPFSFNISLILS